MVRAGTADRRVANNPVAPRSTIPGDPGIVYWHVDAEGTLLYVGSSSKFNFRLRLLTHARSSRWWRYVARVHCFQMVSPDAARPVENALIESEGPIFNRTWRGGGDVQGVLEADYVRSRGEVPNPWPKVTRSEAAYNDRIRQADEMLRALGVLHMSKRRGDR